MKKEIDPLTQALDKLLEELKKRALGQADLWRKIPFLALQADGRSGYSGKHARAYREGYWEISDPYSGEYLGVVDCDSGELLRYEPTAPICRYSLVQILASPDLIDARGIIRSLREVAREPYGSYYKPTIQNKKRNDEQREYGVHPIFRRKTASLAA